MDYRLLSAGLLLCLSLACTRREIDYPMTGDDEFFASLEQPVDAETKVYADENLMVLWHADDRVSVFNKYTYNQEYRFTGETGANAGSFSKVPNDDLIVGNELPAVYAVYPYQSSTTISNQGILTLSLPSEQTYAERSFGRGANTMVSVTGDNNLMFRNLGGYLVLKIYGKGAVSSITLKGKGGEYLAGKARVTASKGGIPTVELLPDASVQEVTLSCPNPVSLVASEDEYKEFWFVLPPVTFQGGFTVTVTGPMGDSVQQSTEKTLSIERNNIIHMAPFEVTLMDESSQPDNEIWYTTTDGKIVEPYSTDGFDASIVSNTYLDGKGIISFDHAIQKIPFRAFSHCATLETVRIPDSVTELSQQCFQYCYSLKEITLSNNLESIYRFAFNSCAISSITLPESLRYVEDYNVFMKCMSLEAFYGKFSSADHRCLVIENELYAFAPAGLTSYSIPEGITLIHHSAFRDCSDLEELIFPSTLVSVENNAFHACFGLFSITIPTAVESIEAGAFYDCRNLKAFYGKFATEDHKCLIQDKNLLAFAPFNMTEYTIPEGVETIDRYVFSGYNYYLEHVHFPTSLKSIGDEAFERCYALKEVVLPPSTTSLGLAAFSGCKQLESVVVKAITPPSGDRYLFTDTNDCPIYVPAQSVEAYKSAPYWSEYADRIFPIEEATPPQNEIWYTSTDGQIVTPDDRYVYATIVSNTYEDGRGVLVFDQPITIVGGFSNCTTLATITMGEEIKEIDENAFRNCSNLEQIQFPTTVESFGESAFWGCRKLSQFELPSSLKTLESLALSHMATWDSITIPESVTDVADQAFFEHSMKAFYGKGATEDHRALILDGRFLALAYQSEPYDYTIPSSANTIVYGSLWQSYASSFTIPETVVSINPGAVADTRNLKAFYGKFASEDHRCLIDGKTLLAFAPYGIHEYVIPYGIEVIGICAFSQYYNRMDSIEIPDSVIKIDTRAFWYSKFQSVTIPASVEEIGYGAFEYCNRLTSMYVLATTPPKLGYTALNQTNECPIYVPASSVEAYRSATNWKAYASRIQAIPE